MSAPKGTGLEVSSVSAVHAARSRMRSASSAPGDARSCAPGSECSWSIDERSIAAGRAIKRLLTELDRI